MPTPEGLPVALIDRAEVEAAEGVVDSALHNAAVVAVRRKVSIDRERKSIVALAVDLNRFDAAFLAVHFTAAAVTSSDFRRRSHVPHST